MQIILKEDVDNLGNRGDVVKVADGYGRNYLIPRGLAVNISDGNLRQIEHERRGLEAKRRKEKASADGIRAQVEALELTFKRKVGEAEMLYGSVTNADIAEALAAQGVTVDKRKVLLAEPLKSLGNYSVQVKLHRDVTAKVRVFVVQDEG